VNHHKSLQFCGFLAQHCQLNAEKSGPLRAYDSRQPSQGLARVSLFRYQWSNAMSEEELRMKIEQLERENAQLKASKRPAEYSVREETYKGHPVLVFEGPSLIRPMSLGVGKLKAVQACRNQIDSFLRARSGSGGESLKI
jgi:hypothetical protein